MAIQRNSIASERMFDCTNCREFECKNYKENEEDIHEVCKVGLCMICMQKWHYGCPYFKKQRKRGMKGEAKYS